MFKIQDFGIISAIVGLILSVLSFIPNIESSDRLKYAFSTIALGVITYIFIAFLRTKNRNLVSFKRGITIGDEYTAKLLRKAKKSVKVTHFTEGYSSPKYIEIMNKIMGSSEIEFSRLVCMKNATSKDNYKWIDVLLKSKNLIQSTHKIIPKTSPVLRQDILIIDDKYAIIEMPQAGLLNTTEDFNNCLIFKGKFVKIIDSLFMYYWNFKGGEILTSNNFHNYLAEV